MNLESCLELLDQVLELTIDEINQVEDAVDNAPAATSLSEQDARNAAYDLADTELTLRSIKEKSDAISSAVKSGTTSGLLPKIETRLNELMVAAELPSIDRQGKKIIPYSKHFWSALNGVNDPRLHQALIAAGLGDLVAKTVNTNSLRSAINEYLEDHEELPADLEALVRVRTVPGIRVNSK